MNDRGKGLAILILCLLLAAFLWGASEVLADIIVNGAS